MRWQVLAFWKASPIGRFVETVYRQGEWERIDINYTLISIGKRDYDLPENYAYA